MIGYIYKITNPNGKVYIGQTINIIKRKSKYNRLECKNQKALYNSLSKYGFNKHTFEIIDETKYCGMNNWLLDKLEIFWIEEYKSNVCKYTELKNLNLTNGGKTMSGYKASEETKRKLSIIHTGKKHRLESIQKMRKIKTGDGNGFYNKKHTTETKYKMSIGQKKRYDMEGSTRKKIIVLHKTDINYIQEFESISKCSEILNLKRSSISWAINKNNGKMSNYIFKVKE